MPTTVQAPCPPPSGPKLNGMASDIQNVDPNGDVVLVLTRYVQFEDEDVTRAGQVVGHPKPAAVEVPADKPLALASENEKGACGNGEERHKADHRGSAGSDSMHSDCSIPAVSISSEEVIIRASSRHLTLASPVFHAMLSRKFSESNALSMTGSVEIPLPDDDPDAFLILLNILHGRIRKVPLTIDLETFTQISVLVDKYDILEPVELLASFWFDNLKSAIPERFTDDIPAWICICSVFDKPVEFLHATRLAMRQGKGDLEATGLPIPPSISGTFSNYRRPLSKF